MSAVGGNVDAGMPLEATDSSGGGAGSASKLSDEARVISLTRSFILRRWIFSSRAGRLIYC
ncbi:hypothetical protein SMJ63A_110116 [Stenotrophomonas geniculata]